MNDEWLKEAIQKTISCGIIVDTNLLIPYFIGLFDINQLKKSDTLFSEEDFFLLHEIINPFSKKVTTPNILTEVFNKIDKLKKKGGISILVEANSYIESYMEIYKESKTVLRSIEFMKLGLSDSVTFSIAKEEKLLLLTADKDLYYYAEGNGVIAFNFNHLRV